MNLLRPGNDTSGYFVWHIIKTGLLSSIHIIYHIQPMKALIISFNVNNRINTLAKINEGQKIF